MTVGDSTNKTYSGTITYSSTGTFTKQGSGSLTLNNIRVPTVNVTSGTLKIASSGTASATSVVKSLSISSGATLDLTNNAIVVDYSGSSSPLMTINGYIASAYDSGNWDDAGLTSTTAQTTRATAVGYNESSVALGISGSGTATWAGQTVNATSVLAMFTWYGDLNLDGVVDSTDLGLMGSIPTTGPEDSLIGWFDGDLNYDGHINADDYSLFSLGDAFQNQDLEPSIAMADPVTPVEYLAEKEAEYAGESQDQIKEQIAEEFGYPVPEPAGSVLGIGIFSLLGRRRRKMIRAVR